MSTARIIKATQKIVTNLAVDGFSFIKPSYYQPGKILADHLKLANETYHHLPADKNSLGCRYRAYMRYVWSNQHNTLIKSANTTYHQPKEYNSVDGVKQREFSFIQNIFSENSLVKQLIAKNIEIAKKTHLVSFDSSLEVGLHQIRYKAQFNQAAFSSPPWLHRDNEPLVFVHLFNLSPNAIGGDNLVAEDETNITKVIKLKKPLETFVVNKRFMHAVTPLGSQNWSNAYRDILLVTFDNVADKVAAESKPMPEKEKETAVNLNSDSIYTQNKKETELTTEKPKIRFYYSLGYLPFYAKQAELEKISNYNEKTIQRATLQ